MLIHPTEEADKGRIIIQDVNAEVFEQVLKFMYTDQIGPEVDGKFVEEMYRVADKYDIRPLMELCEDRLLKDVAVGNALLMYDLAGSHPGSTLAKKSLEIISKQVHFSTYSARVLNTLSIMLK